MAYRRTHRQITVLIDGNPTANNFCVICFKSSTQVKEIDLQRVIFGVWVSIALEVLRRNIVAFWRKPA